MQRTITQPAAVDVPVAGVPVPVTVVQDDRVRDMIVLIEQVNAPAASPRAGLAERLSRTRFQYD